MFSRAHVSFSKLYTSADSTNVLQNEIHAYLKQSHAQNGTNYAEVNFFNLFNTINQTASAFGYTDTVRFTGLI